MVLLRRHLHSLSGEPEDYGKAQAVNPHLQRLKATAAAAAASSSRTSSPRPSTSTRHPVKGDAIPRLASAFNTTLVVRSKTPMADAHDPDLDSKDLPSHHVPTFVSVAHRAVLSGGQSHAKRKGRMASSKTARAAEALKSSSVVPAHYRKSLHSNSFVHSAATQKSAPTNLPLLTYRNPWDSFRPPTLVSVWKGLRWGLPEEYDEGDQSKYRGQGKKAKEAETAYQMLEAEFGKDWADVDVMPPNWGWPEADRQTSFEGRQVHDSSQKQTDEPLDRPLQARPRREWQDPEVQEPSNHARVTWLGHATVLLQLPPLADPVSIGDEAVEQAPGQKIGDAVESPVEEKQARGLINQIPGSVLEQDGDPGHVVSTTGEGDALSPGSSESSSSNDHRTGEDKDKDEKADDDQHSPPSSSIEVDNIRDRSLNILFDPVFSKRCSPSQTVGPSRFTEVPCQVEDLPPIDVILLSHDHYDHSDVDSLRRIYRQRGQAVHIFAALGNKDWLCSSVGFKTSQVSELDWWDEAYLTASGPYNHQEESSKPSKPPPSSASTRGALRIVCTPAQHGSGRAPGGKDSTLWCSWVVEHIAPASEVEDKVDEAIRDDGAALPGPDANYINPGGLHQRRFRVFQAGDTGLRRHGEKVTNRKSPVCPAFEEIARRYGTPDLLLLPISIGSSLSYLRSKDPFPRRYSPFPRISESLTSSIHMDTEDAVQLLEIMTGFPAGSGKGAGGTNKGEGGGKCQEGLVGSGKKQTDVKGAKTVTKPVALAIHFGTFVRNEAQTKADVRSLREACQRHNVRFARTEKGRIPEEGKEEEKEKVDDTLGKFLVSHQGETIWMKM